jgi:hypothetical protein
MEVTYSSEAPFDFGSNENPSFRIRGAVEIADTNEKKQHRYICMKLATLLKRIGSECGQEFCKANKDTAVGSSISSTIAEMFLQTLEQPVKHTLENKIITTTFLLHTINQNHV